jgi:hypothetical protein
MRVAVPAIGRVLETLRERHFKREGEVITVTFLIAPDAIKPKAEFLPCVVPAFVYRTDQEWRQPCTEGASPQRAILVRVF